MVAVCNGLAATINESDYAVPAAIALYEALSEEILNNFGGEWRADHVVAIDPASMNLPAFAA